MRKRHIRDMVKLLDTDRDPPWLFWLLNGFIILMKGGFLLLIVVVWLMAQIQEARGNDLLNLLPGVDAGSSQVLPHLKNRDLQRRNASARHQSQMQRHRNARDFQRAQAERAWAGTVTAPATDKLPVLIQPTVFSYAAALRSVLRIARGDKVIFRTSARTGFLELLEVARTGDRTCRSFRQVVRTRTGSEISFGSACRMRDGDWRFSFG